MWKKWKKVRGGKYVRFDCEYKFPDNNYVNELGKNNSNVGGKYKIKENLKFDEFEILNLPNQLNTRKIIEVGSRELLIISNNDFSYLIKK